MENYPDRAAERGDLALVMLFLAASALVDLVAPSVSTKSRGPELPMLLLGGAVGQAGLLAIYAVLGPQRLLVRWSVSLLVTISLWGISLLGIGMVDRRGIAEGAAETLMLPLFLLAVQLPLWIVKMLTGWRIVLGGGQDSAWPAELRQFRLQQMLVATAVVAAAFGLASLGLPHLYEPGTIPDTTLWLALMLACLIFCVLSALSTLPCVWAVFVARNKAAGAVAIAIYALLMSVLAMVVISVLGVPGPPVRSMRIFVPFLGGLGAVMLGCLHLARWCGYVLLRPRQMRLPATPRDSSPFADTGDPSLPPSP